jgi:hypothetical protein
VIKITSDLLNLTEDLTYYLDNYYSEIKPEVLDNNISLVDINSYYIRDNYLRLKKLLNNEEYRDIIDIKKCEELRLTLTKILNMENYTLNKDKYSGEMLRLLQLMQQARLYKEKVEKNFEGIIINTEPHFYSFKHKAINFSVCHTFEGYTVHELDNEFLILAYIYANDISIIEKVIVTFESIESKKIKEVSRIVKYMHQFFNMRLDEIKTILLNKCKACIDFLKGHKELYELYNDVYCKEIKKN